MRLEEKEQKAEERWRKADEWKHLVKRKNKAKKSAKIRCCKIKKGVLPPETDTNDEPQADEEIGGELRSKGERT